jgi:twitching motility protein PilT
MVLIGEMRDIDTISTALLCAETGKLVLGTLHTTSAMQTVERILNVYPAEVQETVRAQFASVLVGIVCQALPRRIEGGRCAAFEILVANDSMKNLIRENKPQMMVSALETGKDYGMQTLDQHLSQLVLDEIISFEEGYAKCQNPKVFADVEKTLENKKKEKEKKEKMKSLDPFADFNPPTINTTAKKQ